MENKLKQTNGIELGLMGAVLMVIGLSIESTMGGTPLRDFFAGVLVGMSIALNILYLLHVTGKLN